MLAAKGNPNDALQLAARGASSRLQRMLETPIDLVEIRKQMMLKAPVSVGSTTGTTWAAPLAQYQEVSAAFVASLVPYSAFDRLLDDRAFTPMPLRTRIAVASTAAIGSATSELSPKPISAMSFAQHYLQAY